jgi:hypothetical protein
VPVDETGVKKDLSDAIQKDPPKANQAANKTAWDDLKQKKYFPQLMDAIDKGLIAPAELRTFVKTSMLTPELKTFKNMKPELQVGILNKLDPEKDKDRIKFLVNYLHSGKATLQKMKRSNPKLFDKYQSYRKSAISPQNPEPEEPEDTTNAE